MRQVMPEHQPADRLLASADLVITIGCNPVEYWPQLGNKDNPRKIVRIDVNQATLDEAYTPYIELTGDIGRTLEQITLKVARTVRAALTETVLHEVADHHATLMRGAAHEDETPIHPLRLSYELQNILAEDMTLCLDMGSFYLWLARNLYSFRARQILISNGQQTLGVALPWAIAASLVQPHEKVISVSGDGGFLFLVMELETAVRLKAHIVHVIWIDRTYDMIATQEIAKYGRSSGAAFGPVDPVRYAEAFGAIGMMIHTADQIAPTLKRAMKTAGPVIIGVHVDKSDNHKSFEAGDRNSLQ